MKVVFVTCLLGLATCHFLIGCQRQQLYTDNRLMMGTFVEVSSPSQEAPGIVFDEIARIERLLSKYDPSSEVSRLNQAGKAKVSAETFFVIQKSVEFWRASDGAFDITVAPLMDLWGFTSKHFVVPEAKDIADMLRLIGSDKIILNTADSMIEFKLSGMKIDLGGVAKGYALDCAVKKLKSKGIKSCLINAGGQVYCLGDTFGSLWQVAIRNPRGKGLIGSVALKDQSVSTSGDYEQFFVKDNVRYSHILDPRTGYPVVSGIAAVTVIASDGLTADALSTCVLLMGEGGYQQLLRHFPGTQVKIYEYPN